MGGSENLAMVAQISHRENFVMCAKFSLCEIANFFFKNKIKYLIKIRNNNNKNKIIKIKIKLLFRQFFFIFLFF